jgi:vancomycin resistance protein YoaR
VNADPFPPPSDRPEPSQPGRTRQPRRRPVLTAALIGLGLSLLLGGALAIGINTTSDTIAPGLRVGNVELGGLSPADALSKLQTAQTGSTQTEETQIEVQAGTKRWTLPAGQLGWSLDTQAELAAAVQASSERSLLEKTEALIGQAPVQELPIIQQVDAAQTRAALKTLTAALNTAPKDASVAFNKVRYVVKPGSAGVKVDLEAAVQNFELHPGLRSLTLNVVQAEPGRSTRAMQTLSDQANALLRPITIKLGEKGQTFTLTALQVANLFWVRPEKINTESLKPTGLELGGLELDKAALAAKVKQIASAVDQPAQNARYALKGGALVRVAEKTGVVSDPAQILELLSQAVLDPARSSLVLTATVSEPTLRLADLPDAAKLSLIASGRSTYYHSSSARRTNVANAAAKINGAVVAPGEDFSFLNTLGGISAQNGFVTGLIIAAGRTVDGLGGGVCQVSTTTFRALYQAGLPVVERNQHAYRVGYYEPQVGFEAAVYDPTKDLKLKNDTGGPILVKTLNDNARSTLTVQVWGLPQTRRVSVSPATILSRVGHPAPKYEQSAALPKGAVKQIDWAADGFNLYITRTIADKGQVKRDQTYTNYKPWQAVYQIGTRR